MENLPTQDNDNTGFLNLPKENFWKKKLIIILSIFFCGILFFYVIFFTAPLRFPKGEVVSIKQGENLRVISLGLKEKKIIRSRIAFEAFVIMFGGEKHIAIGDYLLESRLPVFEVARRIVEKDRRLASVKLTIPEGFDNNQIAELASMKLKNFNSKNFLTNGKEGYLFPDTYFFFSSDEEQDVLKYMSDNFNKKIKTVSKDITTSGKTENEIIIMASIIEREAKGDADRVYISGILWNRIKKNMPLQVDAAPQTYKTKGLPNEPISNPGMEAIKASIYPVVSNYLYYLHDKDGVIHYARTFEEHKKNKLKYLK
ncbi:MAG: endolytic transglycosylase MltG [bacterium]